MVKHMAYLGHTLLFLLCTQCVISGKVGNTSGQPITGYIGDQLSRVEEPQCEKSERDIHLKLTNVGIKEIHDKFIDNPFVTCLSLDNNGISNISPAAFNRLPNLSFLDLSKNTIAQGTLFGFSRNENLKTLVLDNALSSSKFPYISGVTFPFPNLEVLHLRRNRIFKVALNTLLLNLTHLHLSENDLRQGMDYFFDGIPSTVTHLSLDGNSIGSLRLDDHEAPNLVFINLNKNKFTDVCCPCYSENALSISLLRKLQYLLLSGNHIRELRKAFFGCIPQLLHLDVSHNEIGFVDGEIFDQFDRLRDFIANDNRLKEIPSFSENPNIKKINLRNNQIQEIKNNAFGNLTSLVYLDLSGNGLRYLPEDWTILRMKLRVLLLEDNLFTDFQSFYLTQAVSLTALHIEGNPITSFSTPVLIHIPEKVTVYVQNLKCKLDSPPDATLY